MFEISGKKCLITGGASGLGAGYAEGFLKEGAEKVAILDVAEELGEATAKRLNQLYPGSVTFIRCDVSKEEDISRAFEEVVDQLGFVDVIINNAGIMNDSPAIWRTACDVNVQGLFSFTMKGVKHMRKDEGGRGGTIINISSVAGVLRTPFTPMYSGCKAAVLHFSQILAMDTFYETTGIRVLTNCLGATDTALLHNLEKLSYDHKLGNNIHNIVKEMGVIYQKPESVVRGVVDMYRHGVCGSVWLINNGRPAVNITSVVNEAYALLEKTINDLTQ